MGRLVSCTPHPYDIGDATVALTAHLFQALLFKQYEARLTVVDDELFATRIDAGSEAAKMDWRRDPDSLRYSKIELPVFLEVNPNGQWAFIEDATGQPITAAIADALEEKPHD
jgi:hypothetical protein